MKHLPVSALIVDDEPAARGAIRTLLAEDPEIEIVGECANGRAALDDIRRRSPDLVFLDIQMPDMDGITMLRQLDPRLLPVVLFVTAYDSYALRAFEVHALDYLLKPFDDGRFREAVTQAKHHVRQRRAGALTQQLQALLAPSSYVQRLAIKGDGRVMIVNTADVDWFEAEGDYVRIHTGKNRHLLRETMKRLEEQLDPAQFVRIHRSTIVNIDRIKELQPFFKGEYVVLLTDGTSLKMSRGYKAQLEKLLGRAI